MKVVSRLLPGSPRVACGRSARAAAPAHAPAQTQDERVKEQQQRSVDAAGQQRAGLARGAARASRTTPHSRRETRC